MRIGAVIVAAALLASTAFAAPSDAVFLVTYSVCDLPVFRAGTKFDPSLLIAHIEHEIDPKSWTDGDASISVYKDNLSLVVGQTAENHDRVRALLDSLRKD